RAYGGGPSTTGCRTTPPTTPVSYGPGCGTSCPHSAGDRICWLRSSATPASHLRCRWCRIGRAGVSNGVGRGIHLTRLVTVCLGEPEVGVRPGCDPDRIAVERGGGELGDGMGRRVDLTNLVATGFREPEVAIGAARDHGGPAAGGGDGELVEGHGQEAAR